ncbi:MAG: alpha/beta fold hydrolase [Anaerolineae bacterium]|nr:alpha/beta fold hydrolase [Anaerolineae bacterium]
MAVNTTSSIPPVRRGAEPFLLDGQGEQGDVGCVCVHGFTASPEEMRWLGEHLNERGLTVYAPRLAGHGLTPDRMRTQHWLDWYDNVRDGVLLLRQRCRKVFAVGLSMGGLLSLRVAAAGLVDGAVVIAAPLYVDNPLMPYARFIKYVRRFIAINPGDLDARVRDIQRAMGRDDYGRVAYDDVRPTASAAQLYDLMQEVRAHLGEITVPLQLIYSRADQTVPFENMKQVADGVRSTDLVQHVLERSDHVVTQEIEREAAYALVWQFLSERLS